MEKEKTLLQKYDIPLSYLDFAHVEKCQNAREMEKIVQILRSGEEGYFPDLMRVSEEKLKQLKPNSKLFRYEEPIRTREALDVQELKPIYDWMHEVKPKDEALKELDADIGDIPPIRPQGKIFADQQQQQQEKKPEPPRTTRTSASTASTDYRKWDKYDPDVELLKMDLDEERTKEKAKSRSNINTPEAKSPSADYNEERWKSHSQKYTQFELEAYAEQYRLRGNEFFRAKEYGNAISEYNRAIIYNPKGAARAFNNRAVSQLKLKNYSAAEADCEEVLKLEPDNIKARLRLAEACSAQGRQRESVALYQKVLEIDPQNSSALKALEELHKQLGELAPAHATRLTIEELPTSPKPRSPKDEKVKVEKAKVEKAKIEKPKVVEKQELDKPLLENQKTEAVKKSPPIPKEYDLAELVKPNRMVKSKLVTAAEALGKMGTAPKSLPIPPKPQEAPSSPLMLRMPEVTEVTKNKSLLIQEL